MNKNEAFRIEKSFNFHKLRLSRVYTASDRLFESNRTVHVLSSLCKHLKELQHRIKLNDEAREKEIERTPAAHLLGQCGCD